MKLTKHNLRRATGLTISMTILATLLSACGGGGTTAPTTPQGTTNVVPFKGMYISGSVTVFDANHIKVGSGTINANGTAQVSYNKNAQFPLILEVVGTYMNELGGTQTNTIPLRGLILDQASANSAAANPASGIPVTGVTEIAVTSLGNNLIGLTGISAVAALQQTEEFLGLPQGSAGYTPVFNANGQPNNALTLQLAALSFAAGSATPNTNLVQSINTLGTQLAALNPASAPNELTALTNVNLTAAMNAIAPLGSAVPAFAASASSVQATQSAVAATAAMNAANYAAAQRLLSDMTTTGLRNINPGQQSQIADASGVVTTDTWYPTGNIITGTVTNGIYTAISAMKELVNTFWTAITGNTNNAGGSYTLTSSGWVNLQNSTASFTLNADGTATVTNMMGIQDTGTVTVAEMDISNWNISATGINPASSAVNLGSLPAAPALFAINNWVGTVDANGFMFNTNASGIQATPAVAATGVMPAGSRLYTIADNGVSTADIYNLQNSPNQPQRNVTDINGADLTALPVLGTPFCALGIIFQPIPGALAGADNYNLSGTMNGCTATSINASLAFPPIATALVALKATGNPIVPNVEIFTTNAFIFGFSNSIVGVVAGKAYLGRFYPAGSLREGIPRSIINVRGMGMLSNQKATDAITTAYGWSPLQ